MKQILRKAASLVLSAAMLLSMAVSPAWAAEKALPTEVKSVEVGGFMPETLNLDFGDNDYLNAITAVTVADTVYTKGSVEWGSSGTLWNIGSVTSAYGSYQALKIISSGITFPVTVKLSAANYADMTIEITKGVSDSSYSYTAKIVTGSGTTEPTEPSTPGQDTEKKDPPTSVTGSKPMFSDYFKLDFADATDDWMKNITTVKVDSTEYTKSVFSSVSSTSYYVQVTDKYMTLPLDIADPATCVISADGYKDLTLKLSKSSGYSVEVVETTEPGKGEDKEPEPSKSISLASVSFKDEDTIMGGYYWYLRINDIDGYAAAVTGVKVNDTAWEAKSYTPSSSLGYYADTVNDCLIFSQRNFGSDEKYAPLKSGDVITITAAGYEDLTFKLIIDPSGDISLVENDGQGDPYQLHVKLAGNFEAAIVGQKDYDGVSGATGAASVNNNSNVTAYVARTEKGKAVTDEDWIKADASSANGSGYIDGSKCTVSIVPDTAKGTDEDADSGMRGVFMPAISSSVSLDGTPKDAGSYLISVTVTDDQGRTATSDALPFRVYSGEETLADQLKEENFTQYQSGLYAWDIMEPWAISKFGSNVAGETESVRVPKDLEVWFGSHQSGTYGVLGYDLAWEKVEAGEIPQTLYIPDGCDLTITNMEILSSVHIVVERGGKLTLDDSGVQGIIDVLSGGTFSMNYSAFEKKFATGASINGQLRLADGAILENAAIYSHINYLANGDLTDRTSYEPVVTATGSVTVKGQVFIMGDAGGEKIGQMGLRVKDGTITLADGAVLAVYGGEGDVVNTKGGTAIELDNGTITGHGKVIAIGGQVLWMKGGSAVTGSGTISTDEAFLQGATASKAWNADPGKAVDGNVKVTSPKRHVADGTQKETVADDPLYDLYWKAGIDTTPDLSKYETKDVTPDPDDTKPTDPDNGDSKGEDKDPSAPSDPKPSAPDDTKPSDPKQDDTKPADPKPNDTAPSDPSKDEDTKLVFTDVSAADWYYAPVQWAVSKAITEGTSNTAYSPDLDCTREQMVTFLWRAAGRPAVTDVKDPFTDVDQDGYSYQAILWAVKNGITEGTSDTTFSPTTPCTRAQIVTFLWRAAGKPTASIQKAAFDDLDEAAYYYPAVLWAAEKAITNGMGGSKFVPDATCTRAQGVTFVYRAKDYLN